MKPLHARETLYKLTLMFVGTIVGILLCVLVISVLFRSPPHYYVYPPGLHRTFKLPRGTVPGIEGESHFVINSQGIRGDEFSDDDDYRILAIGASTTECLALDETEVWTALLQDHLNEVEPRRNVWVGNVGKAGLSSRVHILHVKYLLPQYPRIDAVLLLLGAADHNLRLKQGDSYDPEFMNRKDAEAQLLEKAFAVFPDIRRDVPFFKRTGLWRFGVLLAESMKRKEHAHVQDEELKMLFRWRDNKKQASGILDELPDLSSGLDEYARNVNTIIDLAQARSVRPIFLTQPSMWRAGLTDEEKDLLWMGGTGDFQGEPGHVYYSVAALAGGMDRYNDRLLKTCRERNVECFDLARHIPKDTTAFIDDFHFNESGARLVTKAVARYLAERPPFTTGQ